MLPAPGQRDLAVEFRPGDSGLAALLGAVCDPARMRAIVMRGDGCRLLRVHGTAPADDARRPGRDLAAELLRSGAGGWSVLH
jgi:porphobilinogen deaminase